MKTIFSTKYDKELTTILPGELYATGKDMVIATVLGSCVSVCLYDNENKVAGMNHYMLEGKVYNDGKMSDSSTKHALHAIHKLIDCMTQNGAKRENLTAKVFGGGNVLKTEKPVHNVPMYNVRAAKVILEMEDIPILEEDTGDHYTRRLLFDSTNGKVYLKKTR
jgi:chemotaxis protein CheD